MPDIASVLKSEIARIARREVRAETQASQRASARYRNEIATLRRRIDALEKVVRQQLSSRVVAKVNNVAETNAEGGAGYRFNATGLASHRKRLGLSAEAFGALVGVSGQSVYNWEAGKSRPRRSQLAAIAVVRNMGRREAAARLAIRT